MGEEIKYIIKPVSVKDIIDRQYRKGRYNREDIFVRYMCIEEYYNGGSRAWKTYKKMQYKRNLFSEKYARRRLREFHALIESISKDGFRMDIKGIRLDKNWELSNGSHRLATCLYFGIDTIGIKYPCDSSTVMKGYSLKWLHKEASFSEGTCRRIKAKRLEVFEKLGLKNRETNPYY